MTVVSALFGLHIHCGSVSAACHKIPTMKPTDHCSSLNDIPPDVRVEHLLVEEDLDVVLLRDSARAPETVVQGRERVAHERLAQAIALQLICRAHQRRRT